MRFWIWIPELESWMDTARDAWHDSLKMAVAYPDNYEGWKFIKDDRDLGLDDGESVLVRKVKNGRRSQQV